MLKRLLKVLFLPFICIVMMLLMVVDVIYLPIRYIIIGDMVMDNVLYFKWLDYWFRL